jgi:hypothetical protein
LVKPDANPILPSVAVEVSVVGGTGLPNPFAAFEGKAWKKPSVVFPISSAAKFTLGSEVFGLVWPGWLPVFVVAGAVMMPAAFAVYCPEARSTSPVARIEIVSVALKLPITVNVGPTGSVARTVVLGTNRIEPCASVAAHSRENRSSLIFSSIASSRSKKKFLPSWGGIVFFSGGKKVGHAQLFTF